MNQIQSLEATLHRQLPTIKTSLEEPFHEDGVWWLDARHGEHAVVIDWRPSRGFGVSSLPAEGFGDRSDERYRDPDEVVTRTVQLLTEGVRTQAPDALGLRGLRESQRVSQQELAALLGAGQAAISKIEKRDDLSVQTLRRIVEALGGELRVQAVFGDRPVLVDLAAR